MKKPRYVAKPFPDEVKESIFLAQNGYCKNCLNPIVDFHHKLKNSKNNNSKYPILVNSCINCVGLCRGCHSSKSHLFRIKPEIASLYEKFLQELRDDVPF